MNSYFLKAIEKAINTYLSFDPHSKNRLKQLQDKAVSIELLPFHVTFHCSFTEDGVHLQTDELLLSDATIRGTPLQMFGMMMTKENRHRFFADDLTIQGDAVLGQQVVELFDELEIDWEELLSHLTGDVFAHHVGESVHQFKEWIKKSDESFAKQVSLFIHEEVHLQPSREEVEDFFADIDTLRMDVDRAEAKMNHLQSIIATTESEEI